MDEETKKILEQKATATQKLYNDYLTQIDLAHSIPPLEEVVPLLRRLQQSINDLYDFSLIFKASEKPGLRKFLSPRWWLGLFQREREYNATVVHLLNELIEYLSSTSQKMRTLLEAQILFFQQITPWMNVKIEQLRQEQHLAIEEMWFQINRIRPASSALRVGEYDLERLRVEITELRRRLSPTPPDSTSTSPPHYSIPRELDFPLTRDFRYYVFEEIFRGSSDWLTERLKRYVPYFIVGPEPILDIGCGRGEFLQLMKELNKDAYGIELNQYETEKLEDKGLKIVKENALAHLQKQQGESIGGVFCAQVVEHLTPEQVFEMLSRLNVVMKTGSCLVIETVNPLSVFGFHHVYFKDPSHIFPVHPETLCFLMRYAGFQNVQVQLITPLPEEGKLAMPDEKIPDQNLRNYLAELVDRLNQLLYCDIEYYVVGTRA